MDEKQAVIRVTALGGIRARLDWLAPIAIPPGISVEVVDFGYRVNVIVTRGQDEVSVVADLTTGDAAKASQLPDDAPLVQFARLLLEARMFMEAGYPPEDSEPTTPMRGLVEAAGGAWFPPSYAIPEAEGENQSSRTDAEE